MSISVTAPLTPAIDRAKTMLFQPFSLEKWIVIGFAAWLAHLGSSGGGSGVGYHGGPGGNFDWQAGFEQARDYFFNNLYWIGPVIVGAGVIILGLWLLIEWLSSRGQFLFLHAVAEDRAEIVEPWARYRAHGNSLFLFRAGLGLIGLALVLPLIGWGFWRVDRFLGEGGGNLWPLIGWILPGFLGMVGIAAVAALVKKLTLDFVVPIMRLRTLSCLEAWKQFFALLTDRAFDFVLYLLFSILISVATGILVIALILLTCCCAGCLMAIPFIGTVLLLPILVFKRAYSLYFLAQFGPEFNVFPVPAPIL